jgi:LysR family hydrogen peroxide-inducible transcriptional activator
MPSITQLQYILAVDRLKHFGKAAKECRVAQPALSMQIQKVEEEMGIVLFDRNKKPILTTEKGQRFIEQAKVVVREHQKLIQMTKEDFQTLSGEFRLALIPTLLPYLLPTFLHEFTTRYPKVDLIIQEMTTEEIIKAIRNDDLDAAILATPLRERGIKEKVLFYEPFLAYVNEQHPLAKKKKLKIDDLEAERIWLLKDGHCFRNQVTHLCGIKPGGAAGNVSFEGGNFETLRNLVKSEVSYTLVPLLFVLQLPKDESIDMVRQFATPIPTREISLVYSRDQWKTDIVKALQECVAANLPSELPRQVQQSFEILGV